MAAPSQAPAFTFSLAQLGRSGADLCDWEWEQLLSYVAGSADRAPMSERTAAGVVGVVYEAIEEHAAADPAFRAQLLDARSRRIGRIEDALFATALSGSTRAQVEFLRNHDAGRYRSVPDPPPPPPSDLPVLPMGALLRLPDSKRQVLQQLLAAVLQVGPDAPDPVDVTPKKRASKAKSAPERATVEIPEASGG